MSALFDSIICWFSLQFRLKALCYLNVVPFYDKFLSIFKPLLNKDVAKLLKLYDSVEELGELFPIELLPCDYKGGKADSIDSLWSEIIILIVKFFCYKDKSF